MVMQSAAVAAIAGRHEYASEPAELPTLPIARPLLPTSDNLLPYLREIDRNRTYSNLGPLVRRLEERLASRFGLGPGRVVTVANATVGITAALVAQTPRQGSYCLVPAWTFVATAHAAAQAGLVPYLVDVDADSWALEPAAARRIIAGLPSGAVGAVVPVAPFGRPIDIDAWDRFAEETGVAVVIDAAAGFDALRPGRVPAVVSLHATKVLGAGEGGFVATGDTALAEEIIRRTNFGFYGSRTATVLATNAKMSEYHAAVALASLDVWDDTREQLCHAARICCQAIGGLPGVRPMDGFGTSWVATTFVVELPADAPRMSWIESVLAAWGVPVRHWWNRGLHREPAFAGLPQMPIPTAERLIDGTIGLPFWIDMTEDDAQRIASALATALLARGRRPDPRS